MFFLSLANCRCALARVSALFLVIALCLICRKASADIAVLPEPYFTNGVVSVESWCQIHLITNRFVSYEVWTNSYYPDLVLYSSSIDSWCSSLLFEIRNSRGILDDASSLSVDALNSWVQDFYDSNNSAVIENLDYDQFALLWDDVMDVIWGAMDDMYDSLDYLNDCVLEVRSDNSEVRSLVADLNSEFHNVEVLDYVEVGMEPYDGPSGGGCNCPDYRPYLLYLQSQLIGISNRVSSIENELQRFLDGFAVVASNDFGENAYPATTYGSWLATLLGSLQAIYYRDYEHLNIVSTNVLAHILDGWVYPTNRVDDPLFVSVVDGNLESTLQSIFADLEVTVKQGTNVWNVAVTNQVLVSVTNDLENINNIDVEQTAEDLGSKLDELGQPEEIDVAPEDYSTVFDDYKDAATELGQKWKQLFTDAVHDTDNMPVQIRLFSGYQPSGAHFDSLVIVPTTYWQIDTFCASIFRSIRSVCRFLWMILEIAIIARLFKINIFLVYQGIIVLFAVASALGCPGLQKISWGEALNNIATSFRNTVDAWFPMPEDT